jgi:hypothetical protein
MICSSINKFSSIKDMPSTDLLELVISNPYDESVEKYYQYGNKIIPFITKCQYTHLQTIIIQAQQGIIDYCNEYISLYDRSSIRYSNIITNTYTYLLDYIYTFNSDNNIWELLKYTNDFAGTTNFIRPEERKKLSRKDLFLITILGSEKSFLKFKKNPYNYWKNSKFPLLRLLKYFYKKS